MEQVVVRKKKMRDIVRLHQHWKHLKTRQSIYVAQVFRHERRVLAIRFKHGEFPQGAKGDYLYVGFAELDKHYTLMGAYPNAG